MINKLTLLSLFFFSTIFCFAENNKQLASLSQPQPKTPGVVDSKKSIPNLRGDGIGFIENRGQVVDMQNHLRSDILYTGEGAGVKYIYAKLV